MTLWVVEIFIYFEKKIYEFPRLFLLQLIGLNTGSDRMVCTTALLALCHSTLPYPYPLAPTPDSIHVPLSPPHPTYILNRHRLNLPLPSPPDTPKTTPPFFLNQQTLPQPFPPLSYPLLPLYQKYPTIQFVLYPYTTYPSH